MRIMIDTNVLISAILFPNSVMNRLIEKVMTCHSLILCSYIIDEIHELFVRKFYDRTEYLDIFLTKFSYELVYTPMSINPSDYPLH